MRGLDDHITGKYDPNNPANQTDWAETFDNVLDKCEWITDAMLADDDTYEMLGNLMAGIYDTFCVVDKYYDRKTTVQLIRDNAEKMAIMLKEQYEVALKAKK